MPVLLALLAALSQLPPPILAEPGEEVRLTAETAELDGPADLLHAEGRVVLQSGGLLLLTESLDYSLEAREGFASGGLLFVDGTLAVRAREGGFRLLSDGALTLQDAVLWQKYPAAAEALLRVRDAAQVPALGPNLLQLRAGQLDRVGRNHFATRKLRLTSCNCAPDAAPDWSLGASEADVETGERALLWWPTLYVKDVPVLVLPALYVPLSSRRTGFLLPRPGFTGQSGFLLDQPFFWAFHESWDLTLTAGYRFGVSARDEASGTWKRVGTHGPRGSAELRWAPVEGTSGRLFAALLNDRNGEVLAGGAERAPARGWRGEASLRHATDLDAFAVRLDLNLVSDANYLSDETADVLRDFVPYLRSQGWAGARSGWGAVALEGAWYQDMQGAFSVPERWFFGADAPGQFQRPVAVSASIPHVRLLGPLRGGVDLDLSRSQALSLLAGVTPPKAVALSRLDLAPSLSCPLLTEGPVTAGLWARARGDLAAYDSPDGQRLSLRARVVGGASAGTTLSRTFFGGAVLHSVEPRLELRAGTQRWGDSFQPATGWLVPRDEYDELPGAFVQGVASVGARLVRRGGAELGRFVVGQDVDLASLAAADTFAQLSVTPGYVSVAGGGRWDWRAERLATLNGSVRVDDGRGDRLELSYDRMAGGGADRMRASLDQLFGAAVDAAVPGATYEQLAASLVVVPYSGITLRYSAVMDPGPGPESAQASRSFADRILQHTAGLALTSSCDCWRVDVFGTYYTPSRSFGFGFLVDLKNLGSFGR